MSVMSGTSRSWQKLMYMTLILDITRPCRRNDPAEQHWLVEIQGALWMFRMHVESGKWSRSFCASTILVIAARFLPPEMAFLYSSNTSKSAFSTSMNLAGHTYQEYNITSRSFIHKRPKVDKYIIRRKVFQDDVEGTTRTACKSLRTLDCQPSYERELWFGQDWENSQNECKS